MSLIGDFQRLMQPTNDDQAEEATRTPLRPLRIAPEGAEAISHLMRSSHAALVSELIACIHVQPPDFFARLVLDVLLAMGYGSQCPDAVQRLGRCGDGGVDGLITLDELGLDLVYIQAKRLKPGVAVPVASVRDFAGSLEAKHAQKGVFVTTTHFSPAAMDFCSHLSRRVVLIDGQRLAELMVRYNIGVTVEQCFLLKGLDRDYFSPAAGQTPRSMA